MYTFFVDCWLLYSDRNGQSQSTGRDASNHVRIQTFLVQSRSYSCYQMTQWLCLPWSRLQRRHFKVVFGRLSNFPRPQCKLYVIRAMNVSKSNVPDWHHRSCDVQFFPILMFHLAGNSYFQSIHNSSFPQSPGPYLWRVSNAEWFSSHGPRLCRSARWWWMMGNNMTFHDGRLLMDEILHHLGWLKHVKTL